MLTTKQVEAISKVGRHHDRDGLYLRVQASGARSWLFIYMRQRKLRYMGLGTVQTAGRPKGITLQEARRRVREAHQTLSSGLDPISEREGRRRATTSRPTFREATEQFVAAKAPGWRSAKTATQFRSSLARYAYERIGSLPVDAVSMDDVVKILTPIWAAKPVMADQLRTNIAVVLAAAKALGHRSGDNPADWRGSLEHLLPRPTNVRRPKHHAALPYRLVPTLMKALRDRESVAARALEFTILTAARTSEVIGALWTEMDTTAQLWSVSGERMKSGRDHRVPLAEAALAILEKMPREKDNPHVFVGGRHGKGITNMPMLKLLWSIQPAITVHGFRSSFRDWVSEQTTFPREVAEAALAHSVGDRTEAAYARSDLFEKRGELMNLWASFLS